MTPTVRTLRTLVQALIGLAAGVPLLVALMPRRSYNTTTADLSGSGLALDIWGRTSGGAVSNEEIQLMWARVEHQRAA